MRKPETLSNWLSELEFVLGEARFPDRNRMAFFPEYVKMQSNFAKKDGFEDIAQSMAKAIGYELDDKEHERWLRTL